MGTLRRNNKLMALLLSVAMVVTMLPALFFASVQESFGTIEVARYAGKNYSSLEDVLRDANGKADKRVTLIGDVGISNTLNSNVQLELDLNGHVFTVEEGGTVSVTKNLEIVDYSGTKGKLVIDGTINVKGATLDVSGLSFGTSQGLIAGQKGSLKADKESKIMIMDDIKTFYGKDASFILNNGNPKFIVAEKNAKVSIGNENFICTQDGSVTQCGVWSKGEKAQELKAKVTKLDMKNQANRQLVKQLIGDGFSVGDFGENYSLFNFKEVYKLSYPDIAYLFEADQEETNNKYDDWFADFTVSFDKPVARHSLGLAGYYSSYDLALGFFAAKEIPQDENIPLLNTVMNSSNFTYAQIRDTVRQFACGAFNFSPENNDTTMTVELRVFDPTVFDTPAKIRNYTELADESNTFAVETIQYKLSEQGTIPAKSGENGWPKLHAVGTADKDNPIPDGMYYLEDAKFVQANEAKNVSQRTAYFSRPEEYIIQTSSALNGDTSATAANISGGGLYNKDVSVTLKAEKASENLVFNGWYKNDVKDENKIEGATSETYVFPATEDAEYIANYTSEANATVSVGVVKDESKSYITDGKVSVKKSGEAIGGDSKEVQVGEKVVLTAEPTVIPGGESYFICWKDSTSGAVVGTSMELETTAIKTQEIDALFMSEGAAKVEFNDAAGNILSSAVYASSEAENVVEVQAPSKRGQKFNGWADENGAIMTEEAVKTAIQTAADAALEKAKEYPGQSALGRVPVVATYDEPDEYTVYLHLIDQTGKEIGETVKATRTVGTAVLIRAYDDRSSYNLQGLSKNADGTEIFTKMPSITVSPDAACELHYYAVYGAEEVVPEGAITLGTPYDAATNVPKIGLTMSWSIPDDATLIEAGFFNADSFYNETVADTLDTMIYSWNSDMNDSSGSYTIFINRSPKNDQSRENFDIYLRAYIKYELNDITYYVVNGSEGTIGGKVFKKGSLSASDMSGIAYVTTSFSKVHNK